jgi:hypothetical protein
VAILARASGLTNRFFFAALTGVAGAAPFFLAHLAFANDWTE